MVFHFPSYFHMASLKIHEQCKVFPPSATATQLSLPFTFFDLIWLKFSPTERVFFYSLPPSHSNPSFFFDKVSPQLKTSLSLTLQHFLPLAGKIVWPSNSPKPIIQFNPDNNDGVSFVLAQCDDVNFNKILEHNSPLKVIQSRSFVPHLESDDSFASVISVQITLFPNTGFSIGISAHHAVLDGKSSTMFIKAWASICKIKTNETEEFESPTLMLELEPLFNREIIKDPHDLTEILSKMSVNEKSMQQSLKIVPFEPKHEDSVQASFELTREDLDKIKKMVLAKWDVLAEGEAKPQTLSTFVVTCSYVTVCVAKAIQGVEREKDKFCFGFTVDCRARLEPPIPNNYFGNCIWWQVPDTQPLDFIKEEGLFLVAKSIHDKIKMIDEKGVFEGVWDTFAKFGTLASQGIEIMGVSGSNRFGVYEIDFGWGRPAKVEITSNNSGFGLAESRNGRDGVEVGLLLNTHVMDLFTNLFREGLSI